MNVTYAIANYSLTSYDWDFEPTREDMIDWVLGQQKPLGMVDGEMVFQVEGSTYGVPCAWVLGGGTGRSYVEAHLTLD